MKQVQSQIKDFCQKHNLNAPLEHRILDLVSEIGEVSKEVLKMTDYGQKPPEPRAETKSELGDVFFSLIVAANLLNIDLEEALEEVLKKYSQRLDKGDSPDSENS